MAGRRPLSHSEERQLLRVMHELGPRGLPAICRRHPRQAQAEPNTVARAFGISLDTLQNWYQGLRQPTGPAKVLLRVVKRHPEAVLEAVA